MMRTMLLVALLTSVNAYCEGSQALGLEGSSEKMDKFVDYREKDPFSIIDEMDCAELLEEKDKKETKLKVIEKEIAATENAVHEYKTMGSLRKWFNEDDHQENLFEKQVVVTDQKKNSEQLEYIKKEIKRDCE